MAEPEVKVESAEEFVCENELNWLGPAKIVALVEARDAAIRAEGYRAGLEKAAEIAEPIDDVLAKVIRAELERQPRRARANDRP
jgi:hypothetical protein